MPFIKPKKEFQTSWEIGARKSIRNGFRIANYGKTKRELYIGEFQNDTRHGKGIQNYNNGTVYEGEWKSGYRHGNGILSHDCGHGHLSRLYTGMWKSNLPHGFGLRQYPNGCLYKGMFDSGVRHGSGCQYYPNGTIYMGTWVKGKRTGIGRLIEPHKSFYEGEFLNGIKHGRGQFHHLRTGQLQDGIWKDNFVKISIMWDVEETHQLATNKTLFPIPILYLDEPQKLDEYAMSVYRQQHCPRS